MAKFAVFLVAKILKMHIFLTFLNGYIHPNNFKNKKQALGALPQTPLSLARPQGQVANLSTYPYGECWSRFKASRVKCCQGCEATAWQQAFTGWRRQRSVVKGAGGFPCTLPRGERGCGQRPRCCKTQGGRAVERKCAM